MSDEVSPAGNDASPAVSEADVKYSLFGELSALGPLAAAQVQDLIDKGKVFRTTPATVGDNKQLKPLGAIPAFASSFPAIPVATPAATTVPAAAPPSATQPTPGQAPPPSAKGPSPSGGADAVFVGFWRRFGAYMIDFGIMTVVIGVAFGVLGLFGAFSGGVLQSPVFSAFAQLLFLILALVYNGYFLSCPWQATPGKRLLGMRVIRADGRPIGWGLGMGRMLAYYVSSIPLCLGFLMIAWTDQKQALHDKICGTRVVRADHFATLSAIPAGSSGGSGGFWTRAAQVSVGLLIFVRGGIALIKLFTPGDAGPPACESSQVKSALSDIFKGGKLDYSSYLATKSLTATKEENTCWAALAKPEGGSAEFLYRVYIENKEPKVMVTAAEDRAAGVANVPPAPGAKELAPNVAAAAPTPAPVAAQPAPAAGQPAQASQESACDADSDFEKRIGTCTGLINDAALKPQERANAAYYRGAGYAGQGDLDHAIADYQLAIRLDPSFGPAHGELGNAYYGKGDKPRAIIEYTEALRRDPKDIGAYDNRAQTYADLGDFNRALKDYDQAIRLDPKNTSTLDTRACVHVRMKSLDKAEADFARAAKTVEPGATYTPGAQCLAELTALRVAASSPSASASASMQGEWAGVYRCGQGNTGAHLVVGVDGTSGVFHFFPLPQNPSVPEGCFQVAADFDQGSGELTLTPGEWLMRPRGYRSVVAQGKVSPDGQRFSGRIVGLQGCGAISFSRIAASNSLPPACASGLK